MAVPICHTYLHVWSLHGFSLMKELCFLKLGPIWPFSLLRFSADFALTEVICSSGNGSIMSSDSLLKCLPWIIRAIQSNLGITFACWRLKFHIFMVLVGDSERPGKTQMSNYKTPIIHLEKNSSQNSQPYGADATNSGVNGNINNVNFNNCANTNDTTTSESSPSCRDDT